MPAVLAGSCPAGPRARSRRPPHPNPPHKGEGAAQHPVAVLTRPSPCGRGGGRGLGRIMFGIVGVNAVTATEALRLGAMKLPVTTPVVICEDW